LKGSKFSDHVVGKASHVAWPRPYETNDIIIAYLLA